MNVKFRLVDEGIHEHFDRKIEVVCLTPLHCQFARGPFKRDCNIDAQAPSLCRAAKLVVPLYKVVEREMPMQVPTDGDSRLNLPVCVRASHAHMSAGAMPRTRAQDLGVIWCGLRIGERPMLQFLQR
jgi:hypothetical protein